MVEKGGKKAESKLEIKFYIWKKNGLKSWTMTIQQRECDI